MEVRLQMKRNMLGLLLLPVLFAGLVGSGMVRGGETEDFQYALALMGEREEYALAAEKFEDFARRNPSHNLAPKAMFYLGGCYTRMKKDATAAETYMQLVKLYPQAEEKIRQEALSYGGDAWFRASRFDKAAEMYSELLRAYPKCQLAESALYWRAECGTRLAAAGTDKGGEEYRKALVDYKQFIGEYPASKLRADALNSAGFCAYEAKDYPRAQDFFTQFIREFPQDTRNEEALYHVADSCYWQEDYVAAQTGFKNLLTRFPNGKLSAEARAGLGWCSYGQKEYTQAGREFLEASRQQKDRAMSLASLYDAGVAFEQAGDDAAAEESFTQVAEEAAHPRQARALARLGGLARRKSLQMPQKVSAEELQKAEALLNRAFARIDECGSAEEAAGAVVQLGETRLDLERFDAAAEAFAVVARRWPESRFAPYALYQYSLACSEQKKYAEAAEAIRELLKNYPQNGLRLQAAYAMADYQYALGEVEKSRKAYLWLADGGMSWAQKSSAEGRAAQIERANELAAKSLLRLGESYYAGGNPGDTAEAEKFFSRLRGDHGQSAYAPAACLRLGEINEKRGDLAAAMECYEQAQTLAKVCINDVKDDKRRAELEQVMTYGQYRGGVVSVLAAQKLPAGAEKTASLKRALTQIDSFLRVFNVAGSSSGSNVTGAFEAGTENQKLMARAQYYRGEVLYALGRKAESAVAYQASYDAERSGPLADAALFGLAWSRRDTGDAVKAREGMKELTERFTGSEYVPEALLLLAAIKREAGENEAALADARRVSHDYSGSRFAGRARAEEARILSALNRQEEAATELAEYIRKNPASVEVAQLLYAQSWAYWEIAEPLFGRAAQKEKELQTLTSGAEFSSLSASKRTQAEQLQKELIEARSAAREQEDRMVSVLERLVREYPDFPALADAELRLGEAAYDRGELEAAQEHYRIALEKGGLTLADKARYRLAWCSLRATKKAEKTVVGTLRMQALDNFMRVCNDFPQSPLAGECAWRAGELLREENDFSRALNLYEKAITRGASDEVKLGAEYGRALCLLEMKRYSESLDAFKIFLKAHPQSLLSHEASWGAGFAALNLGATSDARDFFTAAKSGDYGGEAAAKARYGLGMIALEEKNYRDAREEFRKVDVFHAQWQQVAALSLLKAAEASRKLGDAAAAAKDLELLLSRYAQSEQVAVARQMLAELKPTAK